ncbi:MAG: purine-binding chemotaxis protein CheW [Epulopiscium sp.]|nr:purine-binding chemotaxis protein CheW [Candidatus Epulonipiscium sp.]
MEWMIVETSVSTKQYVILQLGEESYGVDIQSVQGIEKIVTVARVPQAPACIEGVMNLRGEIIPVMNLRKRFSLKQKEHDEDTRIIITRIEDSQVGLIVDEVNEVIELDDEEIENVQIIDNNVDLEYIAGVGKIKDGTSVVTLLDLKTLIEDTLL